jgi:potassium large conductance calcium-activated channel subfamily M alpha protein 1
VNVSLEKDFPEVTGHVLLCGEISSIYQFVRTMRVKNMGPYRPLIILYPSMPRPIWNKIRNFPKIYFCDGSPLESSDLLRAGIRTASKAVVLASTADASASDNLDDEALVDANSIFATHSIARVRSDIDIVTEILLRNNIPFVDPSDMTLLDLKVRKEWKEPTDMVEDRRETRRETRQERGG